MKQSHLHFLRDSNLVAAANTLRLHQPVSRADLAELTGLGRSTITAIINSLMDAGLVREIGEAESSGGRKPILLELIERARLVLAIRLTARTVTLGLADLNGKIIHKQRRGLRTRANQAAQVLEQASIWAEEMVKEQGAAAKMLGLGIAIPGMVEHATGRVTSAEMGWDAVAVGPWLQERLALPVLVEGEGNAFTLGESLQGAAAGRRDIIGVTLGTTIATGFLLGGQIYQGPAAATGGLAHVLADPCGPPCTCGRRGCLESVTTDGALVTAALSALQKGATSLITELVEGHLEAMTREVVVAAAQDGDRLALDLLARSGALVGTALGSLTTALGPEAVIVGGESVQQAGVLLLDPLFAAVRAQMSEQMAARTALLPARLGEEAWLVGAAGLMLHRVFSPPDELGSISMATLKSITRGE